MAILSRLAFLTKWNQRFRTNNQFEIAEADLREHSLDLLDSLGPGLANRGRTTHKICRTYDRTHPEWYPGAATLVDLDSNSLCLGTTARVYFGPDGIDCLYEVQYDPQGDLIVFQDGDFNLGATPAKWVLLDGQQSGGNVPEFERFPTRPLGRPGYVGPDETEKNASLVRHVINSATYFFTARVDMPLSSFPNGIPEPRLFEDDANWQRTAPPTPATALFERLSHSEALYVISEEGVYPGRDYLLIFDADEGNGLEGPITATGAFDGRTFGPAAVRHNADGTITKGVLLLTATEQSFTPDAGGGLSDRNVVCRTPEGLVAYDTVLEAFQAGQKSIEVNKKLSYVDANIEVYADNIYGNGSQIIAGGGYTLILAKSQSDPLSLFNLSLNGNNLMRSYGAARLNLHNRSNLRGYRFNTGDTVHVYDSSRVFDCSAAPGTSMAYVYLYDSATYDNLPAGVQIIDLRPKDFLRADRVLPSLYVTNQAGGMYRGESLSNAATVAGSFGNMQLLNNLGVETNTTIPPGTHLNGNNYALVLLNGAQLSLGGYNRLSNITFVGGQVRFLGNQPTVDFQTVHGNYLQNTASFAPAGRTVYLVDVYLEYNGSNPLPMFSGGGRFLLSGSTKKPDTITIANDGTTVEYFNPGASTGGSPTTPTTPAAVVFARLEYNFSYIPPHAGTSFIPCRTVVAGSTAAIVDAANGRFVIPAGLEGLYDIAFGGQMFGNSETPYVEFKVVRAQGAIVELSPQIAGAGVPLKYIENYGYLGSNGASATVPLYAGDIVQLGWYSADVSIKPRTDSVPCWISLFKRS